MFGVSGQNVQQHAEKGQEQKLDLVIALEVNIRDPLTRKIKHGRYVSSKITTIIKNFSVKILLNFFHSAKYPLMTLKCNRVVSELSKSFEMDSE